MRRLALVLGVSTLMVLGFGAAFVLEGGVKDKPDFHVRICHSGNGKNYTEIEPANVGVLNGHVKNDEADIIPAFAVIDNGVAVAFEGRNMNKIFGDGFTGAECSPTTARSPRVR